MHLCIYARFIIGRGAYIRYRRYIQTYMYITVHYVCALIQSGSAAVGGVFLVSARQSNQTSVIVRERGARSACRRWVCIPSRPAAKKLCRRHARPCNRRRYLEEHLISRRPWLEYRACATPAALSRFPVSFSPLPQPVCRVAQTSWRPPDALSRPLVAIPPVPLARHESLPIVAPNHSICLHIFGDSRFRGLQREYQIGPHHGYAIASQWAGGP